MNLTIINDTSFKDSTIVLGGNEYPLKKGENVFADIPNNFEMGINVYEENNFTSIGLLLVLSTVFFDWFAGEDICATLHCNSMYKLHTDKEKCLIKLTEINAAHKTPVSYKSVFLDTDDVAIEYAFHTITNKEESKKKYKSRNLMCVFIYLAIAIFVFVCLIPVDWFWIILALICFVCCIAIPINNMVKNTEYFSDEQANEKINMKIQEMLCEKNNPGSTKGFIEKALDKIFKKS